MTGALVEILSILTTFTLMGTLICVCWNGFLEFRFGQKSAEATFFFKVCFPTGVCSCGWFYLLQYKDVVQRYFNILSIALCVLSVVAAIYIACVVWKYLKCQSEGSK